MDAVKSPNPNGCWLLSKEWMFWSYLTWWMARSTRATRRTKASTWRCCCRHCCSTTPELGNRCRLLTCYTISKSQHLSHCSTKIGNQSRMVNLILFMNSQHPFHYQELASMKVRRIHSIHSITKRQHPLGLGEFTASIPLLNKIGNQSRMLNSYLV